MRWTGMCLHGDGSTQHPGPREHTGEQRPEGPLQGRSHYSLSLVVWAHNPADRNVGTVGVPVSFPSFAYSAGLSLPVDHNTLGLGSTSLRIVDEVSTLLASWIAMFGVPPAAHWITGRVGMGKDNIVSLVYGARFGIIPVVPVCSAVVMSDGCLATWLQFWEPCTQPDSFTTILPSSYAANYTVYSTVTTHQGSGLRTRLGSTGKICRFF